MLKWTTIGAVALLLAACDPNDLPPASVANICKALVGPLKYNTYDKASERYAARVLAMDLAERNRVGRNLRCPQYR